MHAGDATTPSRILYRLRARADQASRPTIRPASHHTPFSPPTLPLLFPFSFSFPFLLQPALFVCSLAAVEKLRKENPGAVEAASATAGLSLGEYTALVFAGALSFEDALKVVKVRAESMSYAAKQGPSHGMMSIVGLSDADVEGICAKVRDQMKGSDTPVCQLANYLFPQGRVIR